ncbi:MAG: zinc-binding alcohol dehydrogenase family protein [Gordonia sp. (in: high G+C Gram-positive bacteria)]
MKAAVVTEPATPPVCTEFPEPEIADGRQIVELVAAGIHPVVRARISGSHYSSSGLWPVVPGIDAVARTDDGRLVYTGFAAPPWGTMAQRIAVPSGLGIEMPGDVDPLAVAAGANPGMSSWTPLTQRVAELGDDGLGTVLVLGATGIAGRIAVDNAFALGATRVVAAGRNTDALDGLRERHAPRGDALVTVALTGDDIAPLVAALDGRPPTTVVDFVWGPVAEAAFQALGHPSLAVDGYDVEHVEIGAGAGLEAAVPGALLRSRRYTLRGSGLGSTPPAQIMAAMPSFLAQIASGTVHVPYRAYPLSQVGEAWAADQTVRAVVVPD